MRMIATKDMTYGTRRLKAGDDLGEVSGPNARLLRALGRAREVPDKPAVLAPTTTPPVKTSGKRKPAPPPKDAE